MTLSGIGSSYQSGYASMPSSVGMTGDNEAAERMPDNEAAEMTKAPLATYQGNSIDIQA